MSTLDLIAASLRGIHITALVSLFGSLLCIVAVLPSSLANGARLILLRLAQVSAATALLVGLAWLCVETALIADTDGIGATLHAMPVVALHTQFGHWLLTRFGLLIAVLAIPWLAVLIPLSAAALVMQPMLGHAGAVSGSPGIELIVSEVLHLLAAGAWLGGLLPLFIIVRALPREDAANACRNFTPIGLASVLLLAVTAIIQVGGLMGGMAGLFGTTYGRIALIKLGLFTGLLALAALNRLVLTERLAANGWHVVQAMRTSIGIEMGLAI